MKPPLLKLMALSVALTLNSRALADDMVKVGILHSLSGTMAISETSLRDVLLFTFDWKSQRRRRHQGRRYDKAYKITPVRIVDGASNWPVVFAEKAKQLLEEDKVAERHVRLLDFREPCKSVLPVFEKDNGVCCSTPVQYEGEELSKNIFYTARSREPAGHARRGLPAPSRARKKFYRLLGTDYVYPQTTLFDPLQISAASRRPRGKHRRGLPQRRFR